MRVVIAAAGTGGHINPGIAIANEIKKQDKNSEILFIGTSRGLENDLVPRAGYELKQIDAYGIRREFSLENFKRLYKTLTSVSKAKKILKEWNADVVVGMGGYISLAVGKAAKKLNIPIALHESNAFPGVAIKVISKSSEVVLLGFEEAKKRIPKAKKIVVTGNPVKIEKIDYNEQQREEKIEEVGLKNHELPIVLVFGGSQGAQSINSALCGIIENNLNEKYQIIWAVGKNNYDDVKKIFNDKNISIENLKNAVALPYIYNMQEMMNLADLVVCRSGAMTITEVSKLEKPAIFIPYPFATENHQEYNARVLEKREAAKIILDKELNAEILNDNIMEIVKDKDKMRQMGKNAASVNKQNVEESIYSEIKKLIK